MKTKTRILFGVLLGALVLLTLFLSVGLLIAEARAGKNDLFGGIARWALILLGIAFTLPRLLADFLVVKGAYRLVAGDYESTAERIPDILSAAVSTVQILAFVTVCATRLIAPPTVSLTVFKIFMGILWGCAGITVTIEIERLDT